MRGALFILLLSGLFALLTAWLHPRAPDFQASRLSEGEISLTHALERYPEALWVDARGRTQWQQGHVPGSVAISEDEWDNGVFEILEHWKPGSVIIVYCESAGCASSKAIALRLQRELQFEHIYHLRGGWEAWLAR